MKKYAFISVLSILMLIWSCTENTPVQRVSDRAISIKTIDFGKFKIDVPTKWERFYFDEGDSIVAAITDKEDTITFVLGKIVPDTGDNEESSTISAYATVSGFDAKVFLPEKQEQGTIRLIIYGMPVDNVLRIEAKGIQNHNRMLNMLSELQVQGGDNKTLIPGRDIVIRQHYNMSAGARLFDRYCASCHHPIKKAAGPALTELMKSRSEKWLMSFLRDKNFRKDDNISQASIQEYGFECMMFPDLSDKQIHAICRHVVNYPQYPWASP